MKKIVITAIIASMIFSVSVYGVNQPPVAQCQDVVVEAGAGCVADASIDNGSSDPDGDPITITQSPEGPYPLGETIVTLTVADDAGGVGSCEGRVEVVDTTPPVVVCQDVIIPAGEDGTADASIDDGSYDICGPVALEQNPPGPYGVGIHMVTLTATDPSGNQSICQAVVMVESPVAVDIKPTSCPNPLNIKSKGVLPVAILGLEDFDVHMVDVATLELEGVKPIRSGYEDVATPVVDEEICECTTEGPDGYLDLTLKFDTQEIVDALGDVIDGEIRELYLTGSLLDGRPFEGRDCVIIRGAGIDPLQRLAAIERQFEHEAQKHESRQHRLAEMLKVAEEKGNDKAAARIQKLIDREQGRYERKIEMLFDKLDRLLGY